MSILEGLVWGNKPVPRARYNVGDPVRTFYGPGVVIGVHCVPFYGVRYDVYHAEPLKCKPRLPMTYGNVPESALEPGPKEVEK